jgi:hypothetical protein
MTITLLTAVLLLSQTTAPPSAPTMTGCVDPRRTPTGAITFTEKDTGHTYQLTGKGLAKYLGQQVEVVGGARRRRLTIRGGLVPSANAAAQAGALDPAQESVARQPGGGASGTNAPAPEFPVTRVRALAGTCPR